MILLGPGLCYCLFMELSPLLFSFGQCLPTIYQLGRHHYWEPFLETHTGLYSLCALVGSLYNCLQNYDKKKKKKAVGIKVRLT